MPVQVWSGQWHVYVTHDWHEQPALMIYILLWVLQIMITSMLRERCAGSGKVVFYAVNPGEVMTDVVRSLPSYIGKLYRLLLKQILLTPMEGIMAAVL